MNAEELSNAERRVLMALSKLGGTGTPWDIIRSSVPEKVAPQVNAIRESVERLMASTGKMPDEREVNELVRALLALAGDKKDDYRADIAKVLATYCFPKWLDVEVPLQRKGFAELAGETLPLANSALLKLSSEGDVSSTLLSQVEVMNASSWLQSKGLVILSENLEKKYSLARKQAGESDLPERKALKALQKKRGKMTMADLADAAKLSKNDAPIAVGWLKRKGWASISKVGGDTVLEMTQDGRDALERKGKDEETIARFAAEGEIHERDLDEYVLKQLLSRQDLLKVREQVMRWVSRTPAADPLTAAGLEITPEETQLTPAHITSGSWKETRYRPYDLGTFAPPAHGGKRHPMMQMIAKVRGIFVSMGFTEVEFDYVQPTFWNMDALFTPQDHPARDMQDTFYLSQPDKIPLPQGDFVAKVRQAHEKGIGESRGWDYRWSEAEATRAVLRTHTTVNSIRYLSQHTEPPVRIFTIGRVFRREATDARHLAEFQMVEGIAMEKDASLAMLKGILTEYYRKAGFEKIRIRPSYFPYTEPSLEVETFYNGRWMELGGAGMFRPEVLEPFGIKHPVMAWGQGLERLAMLLFKVDDIRKLYLSDVDWLREAPMMR
ncbi:MAG: phenylalanine--tRNA ligase subunit alpha [Euryarchaeota archaeon]|nr:phenylalanine--tRNA ligase subunit alpha [Euryarchaeota archaeon]